MGSTWRQTQAHVDPTDYTRTPGNLSHRQDQIDCETCVSDASWQKFVSELDLGCPSWLAAQEIQALIPRRPQ